MQPRLIAVKKPTLLFLITWLFAGTLSAQDPAIFNGYYLTPSGDSITGQINTDKTGGNVLRFREAGQKKWKNLTTKEVRKAGGEQGLDILQQEIRSSVDSEHVFIQKIAGGGYNLYEGKSDTWGKVYYINSKDKPTPIRINKLGYERQLKVIFSACSKGVETKNLRYGSNPLQRYIADLNQCVYPEETPFRFYKRSKMTFGVGLNAYYYTINPNVTGSYFAGNYHRIFKPGVGLTFKVKFLKAFSLYAGLNYIEKNITTDSMAQNLTYFRVEPGREGYLTTGFYNYLLKMDFKYLEIPIGVTYELFPYAKWSPIFHVGYSIQRPVVAKTANDLGYPLCEDEILCMLIPKEPGHLYYSEKNAFRGPSLVSFFGGVGIRRHLNKSHEIELRGDYFAQKEEVDMYFRDAVPVLATIKSRRLQMTVAYHYFF